MPYGFCGEMGVDLGTHFLDVGGELLFLFPARLERRQTFFLVCLLGAQIALALFVGGFAGNVVSTRRRPPARPSIYGAVQRRMDQEKSSA